MTTVRSLLAAVAGFAWTGLLAILYLPTLAMPRRAIQVTARFWIRGLMLIARVFCGLGYQIRGRERLPTGAALVAAKHQSAWDTLIFHVLLDDPVYVLKKELFGVPFIGWYLRKSGNIGIDRSASMKALKLMTSEARDAFADGSQVIVFPEGTRAAPGSRNPYHPGIAALYATAETPVVPVALNSGMFWGRRSFHKYAGTIILEFLEPIEPGLDRRAFLGLLEDRIEGASRRLCAEAAEAHPRLPAAATLTDAPVDAADAPCGTRGKTAET